jgi:Ribbon-Helix-Helix transcriptional regulator family
LTAETTTQIRTSPPPGSGRLDFDDAHGLASIAEDVSPDLARATIDSVVVLGAIRASPAVKAAFHAALGTRYPVVKDTRDTDGRPLCLRQRIES